MVLCCHNSVSRIEKTLQHLSAQRNAKGHPRELLVVDNASSDGTTEYVRATWEKLGNPFPLRLLEESKLGHAFARKTGVLASSFDFGVFCDDDNWLEEDYLDKALELLAGNPDAGAFGGDSIPVSEVPLPAWFYNHAGSFAVGSQANEEGDVTHRGYLWGAGMACRFDVLRKIYRAELAHQAAGRTGSRLSSGDDFELCLWIISAGYGLEYSKRLRLQHFMPHSRLTDDYFERFILTPDLEGASDVYHFFSWFFRLKLIIRSQSQSLSLPVVAGSFKSLFWLLQHPKSLFVSLRNRYRIKQVTTPL